MSPSEASTRWVWPLSLLAALLGTVLVPINCALVSFVLARFFAVPYDDNMVRGVGVDAHVFAEVFYLLSLGAISGFSFVHWFGPNRRTVGYAGFCFNVALLLVVWKPVDHTFQYGGSTAVLMDLGPMLFWAFLLLILQLKMTRC